MQMTESEIKTNIMQAKDQKKQIPICAQVNGCSIDKIREILKKQGVDLRKLKGAAPKYPVKKSKSQPKENAAESQQVTVAQAMAALYARIGELKKERADIDNELADISAQLIRMDEAISGESQQ